jgi:hypothetical protein
MGSRGSSKVQVSHRSVFLQKELTVVGRIFEVHLFGIAVYDISTKKFVMMLITLKVLQTRFESLRGENVYL